LDADHFCCGVKNGKALSEQMFSALPSTTDIKTTALPIDR